MRWVALLVLGLPLAACTAEQQKPSRQTTDEPSSIAAADSLCLPSEEVTKLLARQRPSDEEFMALMGHYAICHQDQRAARQLASRFSDAGVPAAARNLAIMNLNMGRELDTVVPLLNRAARLGDARAEEDLRGLMISTAVADAFNIERIRPSIPMEVPTRFRTPSLSDLIQFCGTANLDDQAFCDEAISQVMIETGACKGRSFASSVAAIRERVRRSRPTSQPILEFLQTQASRCDSPARPS